MTQEEWLKEFERLNGRPATEEEIASVWGVVHETVEDVETQLESDAADSAVAEAAVTSQETDFFDQAVQVSHPSHKLSPLAKLLSGLAAVLVLAFAVFVFLQKQTTRAIDGTWASTWTEEQLSENGLATSLVEDAEYRLTVNAGQANLVSFIDLDEDSYLYDGDTFATSMENNSVTRFDQETGEVEVPVFEGRVDADRGRIVDSSKDRYIDFEKRSESELVIKTNSGTEIVFRKVN